MSTYACSSCGASVAGFGVRCTCGLGIGLRKGIVAAVTTDGELVAVDRDVREPLRFPLGLPTFDRAFGLNEDGRGGIRIGSSVLVGGDPGAGKTTFGIHLGMALDSLGVVYGISESTRELFSLMVRRLGRGEDLRLAFTSSASKMVAIAEKNEARVLIVDQLHSLEPRRNVYENMMTLVRWTERDPKSRTLIVIAERNREGNIRGDFGSEYKADVTIELCKPALADDGLERPERTLRVTKNRHGAEASYPLLLTKQGWEEAPPPRKLVTMTLTPEVHARLVALAKEHGVALESADTNLP